MRTAARLVALAAAALAVTVWLAAWPTAERAAVPLFPAADRASVAPMRVTAEFRNDAFRRATVWQAPRDRSQAALTTTPDRDGALSESPLACRFDSASQQNDTTFDCVLASGEVVTVRYGDARRIQAQVAATHLLARLGFGAEPVSLVPRLQCYGCPRSHSRWPWLADRFRLREVTDRWFAPPPSIEFEWVAVERSFGAPALATDAGGGWGWFELEDRNPLDGHRSERDALTLLAVVLAHWNNGPSHQRLVCLDAPERSAARCVHPFALVDDLASTFGPDALDLGAWRQLPVWADASRCIVSMQALPNGGGTFRDTTIGEPGRRLLLREIDAIPEMDLYAWLKAARVPDTMEWVGAFEEKVQQIRNAGPCPLR